MINPAPPASQISTLPPARGENEAAVSSGLPDIANGEEEKSGWAGEDDKEAPKDNVAEGMEEDDEEILLPPLNLMLRFSQSSCVGHRLSRVLHHSALAYAHIHDTWRNA